jgi:hypothetical protein
MHPAPWCMTKISLYLNQKQIQGLVKLANQEAPH